MNISIGIKCAITTAILSVLVYLLLVNVLERAWGPSVGEEMNKTEWFKSLEVLMLVSVFIAFYINNQLFVSCSP
jgi:hypothetical protein